MKKILFSLLFVALSSIAFGQERQVELYVDASKGQSANLGGRVWMDIGDRMRVNGDVNFSQAYNLFVTAPTDVVELQGTTWVFLTAFDGSKTSQTRPFVFGGVSTTQFIGQANDAVQVPMGFGIQYFRSSGFEFTPTFEFKTQNVTDPNPLIDKSYRGNIFLKIPLGKSFRFNVNPYVSRDQIGGGLFTTYGAKIGFGRVF